MDEESIYPLGSPERDLSDHLDAEGFGGWVNVDEIVAEVVKMG